MSCISDVEEQLRKISDEDTRDYESEPIPSKVDGLIDYMIPFFLQATEEEREQILSKITLKHSGLLFQFSERMAALGVRKQSREYVLKSLLALVIEDFKYDWRDSIRRFALSYNSANKIGTTPSSLFMEAASFARQEVSQALIKFLQRSSSDKSIKAMGYREAITADGFRYMNDL